MGKTSDAQQGKEARCKACGRKLNQGADIVALQEGVLGPRGFIPLEELVFFCSDVCLSRLCGSDAEGERIP